MNLEQVARRAKVSTATVSRVLNDTGRVKDAARAYERCIALGATGTRLVITILYELRRRKKKYGLASACIGGGQGIAIVLEAV